MRKLSILLGSLMVVFCLGCWPKEPCKQQYIFHIPTEITNEPDTIAIGDTVWFYAHYPIKLKDETSGELVDMTKFSFAPKLFFQKIDTTQAVSGLPYATFKPIYGEFTPNSLGFDALEQIIGNEKKVKIGIICRRKGIYLISIAQGFAGDLKINIKKDNCYETVLGYFKMNENRENNFYLLKRTGNSSIQNTRLSVFQDWGGYAFVVH